MRRKTNASGAKDKSGTLVLGKRSIFLARKFSDKNMAAGLRLLASISRADLRRCIAVDQVALEAAFLVILASNRFKRLVSDVELDPREAESVVLNAIKRSNPEVVR